MNDKRNVTTRRGFLSRSAIAATGVTMGLGTAVTRSVLGANDKVRVGFIGVGNRGTQLLTSFMKNKDVEVAALCDVYKPYVMRDNSAVDKELQEDLGGRIPTMGEKFDNEVMRCSDFHKVLEAKDIDAVVIATPDHWHAIQTIMACRAGKDVYVEKPLSITVKEGRKMIEVAEETNRVVQVGLHRRSSKIYAHVGDIVRSGKIGKVTVARAYRISNMYPNGIGKMAGTKPFANMDWDMWLGPRAEQPHQQNIHPYKFRWWMNYSSQVANWGVHYCDAIRWVLGDEAPVSVSAHGGLFALHDDRTVPDTMEVIFELPSGCLLIFGQYEANDGPAIYEGELEFRGTLGNIYTGSEGSGFSIIPSRPGQFQTQKSNVVKESFKPMDGDMTDQNVRNFLDCVKSRKKPNADLETGHRSTTFSHLANISLLTKSRLEWDAKNEIVINNPDANELLHYEYRKPWTLDI